MAGEAEGNAVSQVSFFAVRVQLKNEIIRLEEEIEHIKTSMEPLSIDHKKFVDGQKEDEIAFQVREEDLNQEEKRIQEEICSEEEKVKLLGKLNSIREQDKATVEPRRQYWKTEIEKIEDELLTRTTELENSRIELEQRQAELASLNERFPSMAPQGTTPSAVA
jgi:chromosome segregation ATPase